jgi:phosphatidylglycerophosphatase A
MAGSRTMTAARLIATFGGIGLLKPAPGTWGSLAALPLGWLLLAHGGRITLLAAAALLFALGTWASDRHARDSGQPDPGSIVVDEVVGQWIALSAALLSPLSFLLAFALFRFFDIVKPPPIRQVERALKGGLGIMTDDVMAGAAAAIFLYLIHDWFGAF